MGEQRLELEQDLNFQRREWRVQRVAWCLWALLILAALAGFVGSGPMSSETAASADGRLRVNYDRFVHHHHPVTIRLMISPGEDEEAVRLHISRSLLEAIKIEQIEPQPDGEELDDGGTTYRFRCRPDASSVEVVLRVEFEQMGSGTGELRLADGDPLVLNYFVFP